MSIKDQILATRAELKRETIPVPRWGCDVEVRELDAKTRLYISRKAGDSPEKRVAMWFVYCVYDPKTGKPIFSEGDMDAVLELAHGPVNDVSDKVLAINGVTVEAGEQAEKN